MGTVRQAEILLDLRKQIDTKNGTSRPQGWELEFRELVLAADHKVVEGIFEKFYAHLGRTPGGAHANQIKLGRSLEREIAAKGGTVEATDWHSLTMKQADEKIKELIAYKRGIGVAPVIAISSRRTG
jgi:hypothetical protein